MSLGTSALKVGREPERLRHDKEESMATLRAGTTQNTHLYKVLRERRNPKTGGDQGTSELPQQPQDISHWCTRFLKILEAEARHLPMPHKHAC